MEAKLKLLSPAEYLEREEKSSIKCEYVNGEMYAMSGATRRHNLISSTLVYRAREAANLRKECQVFGSDMKVHVAAHNCFYYPDLSVCCDRDDRNELYLTRPCFLVEVLSPSTAAIDRREKRASYLTIESLREYVIVDQNRMRVDLYRREGYGWQGYVLNLPDDVVAATCLGLSLTLQQIYEGVELPSGVAEPEPTEYTAVEY